MDNTTLDASGLMSLQARLLMVAAKYRKDWTPSLAPVGDIGIKTTRHHKLATGAEVWTTTRVTWYLTGSLAGILGIIVETQPRYAHPSTHAQGGSQTSVALDADAATLDEAFAAGLMEAEVSLRHVCDLQRMVDAPIGIALNDAQVGEVVHVALNRTSAEVTDGN